MKFGCLLVSCDYELVVYVTSVDNLHVEVTCPDRIPAADADVSVVSVTCDEVPVLVIDVKVEVCVAVTVNDYFSSFSTPESLYVCVA